MPVLQKYICKKIKKLTKQVIFCFVNSNFILANYCFNIFMNSSPVIVSLSNKYADIS